MNSPSLEADSWKRKIAFICQRRSKSRPLAAWRRPHPVEEDPPAGVDEPTFPAEFYLWDDLWDESSCSINIYKYQLLIDFYGGRGEIRTHGRVSPSLVFKTSSLNHSDTLPTGCQITYFGKCDRRLARRRSQILPALLGIWWLFSSRFESHGCRQSRPSLS